MLLVIDSPAARLRAHGLLHEEWRSRLSVGERDLIGFLIHYSAANGEPVRATLTQLVQGLQGRMVPLGQSLATLKRLAASLVKKGLLTLVKVGVAVEWCINLAWGRDDMVAISRRKRAEIEGQGKLNMSRDGLNLSRRDQDGWCDASQTAQIEPPIVSRFSLSLSEGREETNQRRDEPVIRHRTRPTAPSAPVAQTPPPAAPVAPASAPGPIRRMFTALTARKPAVAPPAPVRETKAQVASNIDLAWRDGWKQHMPDSPIPPIPADERHILAGLKKRLDSNRSLNSLAFLAWAIGNWRAIMAERFAWMNRPPPANPAIRFMANQNCLRVFLEAYAEHCEQDAIANLGDRDEAEIRRLMATGLTREKAMLEMATARAVAASRQEVEKEKENVRKAYAALQAERQTLRRGPAPPKAHHRPLHERVDPNAWDGIEVDEDAILDLSKMNLKAME